MTNIFKRIWSSPGDAGRPPSREVIMQVLQRHNPYAVAERKWCVYGKDLVGICHEIKGSQAEFHVVEADGTTSSVLLVDYMDLRLARFSEIPASRRPESAAVAAVRGYI